MLYPSYALPRRNMSLLAHAEKAKQVPTAYDATVQLPFPHDC